MDKLQIVYFVLIGLGTLLPIICFIKMRMIAAFKQKGVLTEATITNVERKTGYKGSRYYKLTLEYKVINTGELFIGHRPYFNKKAIGDTMPLIYMPDDPAKFSIDFGKRMPYVLAISIVFLLLIIWFCIWMSKLEYTTA